MEQLGFGAEAIVYKRDATVLKERIAKSYRISSVDMSLRKSRNKREAKILQKLKSANLTVPKVLDQTDFSLEIEFISGKKVRDVLDTHLDLAKDIGRFIAQMHNFDIIHGDLTTSNMLYDGQKVWFIDFGLSQVTSRIEDKAVDLHVLKQALESYHSINYSQLIADILASYETECINSAEILARLEDVEKRGRNKH